MTHQRETEDAALELFEDIYTEFSFTSRWMRIEGFHRVALRLLEEGGLNAIDEKLINKVAYSLQVKPSDIAKAILLAQKYPDLNDLPADKTISWQTIAEYL